MCVCYTCLLLLWQLVLENGYLEAQTTSEILCARATALSCCIPVEHLLAYILAFLSVDRFLYIVKANVYHKIMTRKVAISIIATIWVRLVIDFLILLKLDCSLLCDEEVMFDCIMCIRFLCVLRLSCKETECQ